MGIRAIFDFEAASVIGPRTALFGARRTARGLAAETASYGVSPTAASDVATWKLKLSSRYRRTTSPSWDS
jgi:hypothetical protein